MPDRAEESNLSQRVAHIEARLDNFADAIDNMTKVLGRLGSAQADASRTNWGTVFGGIMLMLAIALPIVSGINDDTGRVGGDLKDHALLQGHPAGVARHAATIERFDRAFAAITENRASIVKQDESLQREMRDLNAKQDSEIAALDKWLQNEMKLNQENILIRVADLSRRMQSAETWQDTHDKRVVGLNAAQWERIYGLERQVHGKARKHSTGASKNSGD